MKQLDTKCQIAYKADDKPQQRLHGIDAARVIPTKLPTRHTLQP